MNPKWQPTDTKPSPIPISESPRVSKLATKSGDKKRDINEIELMQEQVSATLKEMKAYQQRHTEAMSSLTLKFESEISQKDHLVNELRKQLKLSTTKNNPSSSRKLTC